MSINKLRIKEKFLTSKKYINKLIELINENDVKALEEDLDLQLKAERLFEVLTQTLLDVCTHIIAQSNESPPNSYSDCMKLLGKLGILKPETTIKASQMIKMRNILVHQYNNINYKLLFEGLRQLSQDFPNIEKEILGWMDKLEETN